MSAAQHERIETMGQITDAKIDAWQQASGISEATESRAKTLEDMSQAAFELIKIVELERSGIRDGDGHWYGSDPLHATVRKITELQDFLEQREWAVSNGHMTEVEANAVKFTEIQF
jgi:hypothetical protein